MIRRKFISNLLFFLTILCSAYGYAGYDDGESVYMYDGIPGCGCYCHCECFSHYVSDKQDGGFPDEKKCHYLFEEDKVWHVFMRKFLTALKAGPYFSRDKLSVESMVKSSNACGYLCLLSEYLNAASKLEKRIELARIELIEWNKELYKSPKDLQKLKEKIKNLNRQADDAFHILSSIPGEIIPIYKELIASCFHDGSYNMVTVYNRGLIALSEGNIEESLSDILSYIDLAKKNQKENLLTSEVFQKQGESFLEVGLYHQAIEALSSAISKDPNNFEAYFHRSAAYFEIGDFESSLSDYIYSKNSDYFVPYKLAPNEFIDAFSEAAIHNACDAAIDFLPSLCNTAYGLGECLWVFGEHPTDSIRNLASTGYEIAEHVVDYLKNVDGEQLQEYANELVELYENFSDLTDREKGELIGSAVGKYGVDIFAGAATVKGVSAYKKLKEANRICTLESMATSASSKKEIVSKGLQQYSERCKFFENSKIHWGRQNKHIPGKHNYQEGKSIFEHQNPDDLIKKYAGTGTLKRGEIGKPGYQEVIDFKEHIGVWKNKVDSRPTTKGTIHYSKNGAHIVPEHPDAKTW